MGDLPVNRATRVCIVALFVISTLFAVAARGAEPLPTDPALVTGELPNGLRYIVRKHSVPPERAIMWIHVHTGSLNETEQQRGIAHYMEHMAFNGSENFKPGTLVPFFQSMGMTFGRDQNAFTSFDQTTYQLSLPNTKPETLANGMKFFADVVSRLSLLPSEIDNERQIILEERRRGLSANQRIADIELPRLFPGGLYGVRLPIGTEETIKGVKEQDFRDYYGKWYMPSNATLIVIADADPENVIKAIKQEFSDEPAKPRPKPQDLNIKDYDKDFGIVACDPELTNADVSITKNGPAQPPTTTVEQYVDDMVRNIGESAMNRRFREKVAAGKQPYLRASVSAGDSVNAIHTVELSANAKPAKWKEAMEAAALELQRAREFGFTKREVDRVTKDMTTGAERAVETEGTVPADLLMRRINGAVASGTPVMSPKQRLELLKRVLPTITPEQVSKRFAQEFDLSKNAAFVASLPSSAKAPGEDELVSIGRAALAVKPTQEEDHTAEIAELMHELPTPGKFIDQEDHAASQVWSGWLNNNVRVHYRFMDQRKDEVSINIQLIGGPLLETAENRGITRAAQLAWTRAATMHLSSADIREFMNGKNVNVGGGGFFGGRGRGGGGRRGGGGPGLASGDSIALSVSGKPEEIETGMQLAYLLLTEPKVEPEGFDEFLTRTRESIQDEVTNPMRMGMRLTTQAPYPDNEVRLRPLTVEQVDKLTASSAQAWVDKLVRESPIEVVIVGDLPKERAVELCERYLGSLPTRPRVNPSVYADLRKVQRPSGPRVFSKELVTPTNQAFVFSGFYGADETNRPDVRALGMAARILSTRMIKEVREDAQLVYSIGAQSRAATTFPGFGVFSSGSPTDPEKADALLAKINSMYETFAREGPTEDEVNVAKKQYENTYAEEVKQPMFWSGRLNQLDFRGMTLDELMKEPELYQALSAKDVKETFAKYYSKQNAIVVVVKPKNAGPTTRTASADKPE